MNTPEETIKDHQPNQAEEKAKQPKRKLKKWVQWTIVVLVWIACFSPYLGIRGALIWAESDGDLPGFDELENPKSNLASVVYSEDGKELGKYFIENRTNAYYNELSPYLINALIATEDERFHQHSGVDMRATGRVIKGVVTGDNKGGGSTITQQLAKMLFPRKQMTKIELVKRKFKEWIIATRLEKNYTKEEIIAMYFNKFDFLNNAVGINSAAMVYFGKKPIDLELHEAAMLVGMAKNPSLFNPLRDPDTTLHRREVVLAQMEKNNFITKAQYDSIRIMPLGLNYTKVDHQAGLAPYFRESLREEVSNLLDEKNPDGSYKIAKSDGSPYSIYSDGLKIYTTIDSKMQEYAEWAVQEHLKHELQEDFFNNNQKWKNPPFSNDLNQGQIDTIMLTAMHQSQMYKKFTGQVCAYCERPSKWITKVQLDPNDADNVIKDLSEGEHPTHFHCEYCHHNEPIRTQDKINEIFNTPKPMKIFDWQSENYEKDTIMTPMDSIRYHKEILRAAMVSMNPHNGHIKAWVGGPNFHYFQYDMVMKGRRQVGSTFKPFIYATALEDGAITPCTMVPDIQHCVEVPYNKYRNKMWCPGNAGANYSGEMTPIPFALAASMNNITAYVIGLQSSDNASAEGALPYRVWKRVGALGIDTSQFEPVPAMALGVFDLNVYEMVGGMCAFVNEGIYIEPTFINRIEDANGNVIYEPHQRIQEVWSKETAYTMLSMMKNVTSGIYHPTAKRSNGKPLLGGTAIRIRGKQTESRPYAGLKMPIAGKTGTTQNQSDGWFMGLTPDLVTGVWVGAEDRSVRFRSLQLGMGTNMALPIWAYYMHKVYEDSTLVISQEDFPKPASIIKDPLDCSVVNMSNSGDIEFDENGGDGLNIWGQEDEDDIWDTP
ncbi:transglycosylase domain-containing protein [Parvicella tangerina]|uniref:Penicillin-binding protein 1A n=1 Tax=Parvicella tangerina TaxID=2829795 RepID=A0A916JPD2_9FLAO|nr:transglycosylase domain-containing protein [Parvicella tangerina]CAG5085566.1 Penicillin-binding protein 1A [Parvicella tangerina]